MGRYNMPAKTTGSKSKVSNNTVEDNDTINKNKVKKLQKNQCVGFIYGDTLKTNFAILFKCNELSDPSNYIKENLFKYYGTQIIGRYVKCVDCDKALEDIIKLAEKENYIRHGTIMNCNVGNGVGILKNATGEKQAPYANKQKKHDYDGDDGDESKEEDNTKNTKKNNKNLKKSKKDDDSDDGDESKEEDTTKNTKKNKNLKKSKKDDDSDDSDESKEEDNTKNTKKNNKNLKKSKKDDDS